MVLGAKADSLAVESKDSTGTVEVSHEHLRAQMVKAGVWLTYRRMRCRGAVRPCDLGRRPTASLLLALFGIGIATALAIQLVRPERLLRSRYADAFFVTWSLSVIVLIAVGVAADGGARSPLTFIFFLPMVYAAVFYPLRLFVPVGAVDMVAFVLVADLYGHPEPTYVAFIAACLAFSAVLCAWQAQNHDRHRERPHAHVAHRPAHRLPEPARVRGAGDGRAGRRAALGPASLRWCCSTSTTSRPSTT